MRTYFFKYVLILYWLFTLKWYDKEGDIFEQFVDSISFEYGDMKITSYSERKDFFYSVSIGSTDAKKYSVMVSGVSFIFLESHQPTVSTKDEEM